MLAAGLAALAAALASGPAVEAGWGLTGSGAGAAQGRSMPEGAKPAGSVAGTTVTVTWSASTYAGTGQAVGGYLVRRYNAITNVESGGCAGTVTGTTCVEAGVPLGEWRYSVTPVTGLWRGGEGTKSDPILVTV